MLLSLSKWNVRIVKTGDRYGRDMCLINYKNPMVEFYDVKYTGDTPLGQFVSRYYITTILTKHARTGYSNGLCLEGTVPAWYVSAEDMQQVITFLKEHNANT